MLVKNLAVDYHDDEHGGLKDYRRMGSERATMKLPSRESVFRPAALQHDELPDEENHQPTLITPRNFLLLWLALVMLIGGGLAALLTLLAHLAA